MASKLVLLPTLLLALAFVTLCAQSFVFGGRPVSTSSLRSTARAAVPEALADFDDHCFGGFHSGLVGQHRDSGRALRHPHYHLPAVREAQV